MSLEKDIDQPVDETTQKEVEDQSEGLPIINLNEEPEKNLSDNQSEDGIEDDDFWVITFVDGLDQPIQDLTVEVKLPNGEVHELKTPDHGSVFVPKPDEEIQSGYAHIEVKDLNGQMQKVCELDMQQCKHGAVVRSPKVKAKVADQPHHKTSPSPQKRPKTTPKKDNAGSTATAKPSQSQASKPSKADTNSDPWYLGVDKKFDQLLGWLGEKLHIQHQEIKAGDKKPHEVLEGATTAGNPAKVIVGPETGGDENLMLGENDRFRSALIRSAKRLKMSPQVLAALISAEAGTKTKKVPVVDKQGNPVLKKNKKPVIKTISLGWNEDAKASGSSAAGLTQFLDGTWLGQCMKIGTFLYEESLKNGWVKVAKNEKTKKSAVEFVLASGGTSIAPRSHSADQNVKDCLNKRFDPEWSIMAAADYGFENLNILRRMGFKIDALTEAEKAKVMYLMHHEGEGNGPLFIKNNLLGMRKSKKFESIEDQMKSIFIAQVGKAKAEDLIEEADNKPDQAYREWLALYIDRKITIGRFYAKNAPVEPEKILTICTKI